MREKESKVVITVQELIEQLQKIEDKSLPVVMETEEYDLHYMVSSVQERRHVAELCTLFERVKDLKVPEKHSEKNLENNACCLYCKYSDLLDRLICRKTNTEVRKDHTCNCWRGRF